MLPVLLDASRKVLIVDDEEGIRHTLARFLQQSGFRDVLEAGSGEQALDLLEENDCFIVITDISLPAMSGLELLAKIRKSYPRTDVAVITGHLEIDYAIQAIKNGAFDYFRKPFRFDEVLNTIQRVIEKQYLEARSRELELLDERRRVEESHLKDMMLAMARIIDMKSRYTREHADRVSKFSVLICREIGLTREETERIALGASLHDIGKLGVPDCILDKPAQLTPEEYEIVKEHPGRGADLCMHIQCLTPVMPMIRWHHENLDGSGYPDRLKGDAIPLGARIVRIADYWDAITSNRSYRRPMATEQAMKTLELECAQHRLDSDLTRTLFQCVHAGLVQRVKAETVPNFAL